MECQLMDIIQPYHMCMWLLMLVMAAGIAAMMATLTGGRKDRTEHEDLRPKNEEEIAVLIDKIKAERKNDQVLQGATTVSIRSRAAAVVPPEDQKG